MLIFTKWPPKASGKFLNGEILIRKPTIAGIIRKTREYFTPIDFRIEYSNVNASEIKIDNIAPRMYNRYD